MESAYLILIAAFIMLEVYCDYREPSNALMDLGLGRPPHEPAREKTSSPRPFPPGEEREKRGRNDRFMIPMRVRQQMEAPKEKAENKWGECIVTISSKRSTQKSAS